MTGMAEESRQSGTVAEHAHFLEGVVARLSAELAAAHRGEGPSASTQPQEGSEHLLDRNQLAPLLEAYDARASRRDAELECARQEAASLQERVECLVNENTRLHADLGHFAARAKEEGQDGGNSIQRESESDSELKERIDLLQQENDLLITQEHAMRGELTRLQDSLQEHAESLQASQNECAAEKRYRCDAEERADTAEHEYKEAQRRAGSADEAKRMFERNASMRENERAAAVDEAKQAQQRAERAESDLKSARTELRDVRSQLSSTSAENGELRNRVSTAERKVSEYQQRETSNFEQRQNAETACADAQAERDQLQQRLNDANQQLSSLQDEVKRYRLRRETDSKAQQAAEEERGKHQKDMMDDLRQQLEEARAEKDRVEVDKSELHAEIDGLKAQLRTDESDEQSVASSANNKLLELGKKRDELQLRAESAELELERKREEWMREKERLTSTEAEMKRRAHEQEAKASQLSTEVARLEDKADESKRQEEAYRRELERVRGVAWQEAERLRKEKEASQESIAVKLRDEVERHRRTSEEAEELLAERDELLTTLRKEASDATNSYEQELDRLSAQVDDAYAKQQAAEDRASAAQRARREAEEHADALEIARAKAEREAAAAKSRQSHILVPAATSAAS